MNNRQAGLLGKFDLWDWWESEFTEKERTYLKKNYRPLGMPEAGFSILTDGNASISHPRSFLMQFAQFFKAKKKDLKLAIRILEKATSFPSDNMAPVDFHFDCYDRITFFYPLRDQHPTALENAIKACRDQIEHAERTKSAMMSDTKNWGFLPRHSGYDQLAIILEKQKDFQDALEICVKGKSEGWSNDFDKRIARLEKKLTT